MIDPKTVDIASLPSIPLVDRKRLPNCIAVYFVLECDRVIYIGQSSTLALRWAGHSKLKELKARGIDNIKLAWLECSDSNLLLSIESALIVWFKPELNQNCKFGGVTSTSWKPKWNGKTTAIRIPSETANALLEIARAIDSGRVNSQDILELIK